LTIHQAYANIIIMRFQFAGYEPAPVIPIEEQPLGIRTIFDAARSQGYEGDLKIRRIARERIPLALATGTDRDVDSRVDWDSGHDEEARLMQEAGVRKNHDVTYVHELGSGSLDTRERSGVIILPHNALLVYRGDRLERLGNQSNGFHRFTSSLSHATALLVVFEPITAHTPSPDLLPRYGDNSGPGIKI
jgi:hypothetical protein